MISKKFAIIAIVILSSAVALGIIIAPKTPDSKIYGLSTEVITQVIIPFPTITPTATLYAAPIRLIIPKINVAAKIILLGQTAKGDMDVPSNLTDVGWYKYGPHPGEFGSAVIAGHQGVGADAVFMNLYKLQVGDTFWVIDANNQKITFIVRKMQTYDPTAHPREVFLSESGYHLNLITCTGDWDKAKKTMSQRLVVFADKVDSTE